MVTLHYHFPALDWRSTGILPEFQGLREQNLFTDLNFVCYSVNANGNRELRRIQAHQVMLARHSKLMDELFKSRCCSGEKREVVSISLPGVDVKDLVNMLELLYSGEVTVESSESLESVLATSEALGMTLPGIQDLYSEPTSLSVTPSRRKQKNNFFTCPLCSKSFIDVGDLKSHVASGTCNEDEEGDMMDNGCAEDMESSNKTNDYLEVNIEPSENATEDCEVILEPPNLLTEDCEAIVKPSNGETEGYEVNVDTSEVVTENSDGEENQGDYQIEGAAETDVAPSDDVVGAGEPSKSVNKSSDISPSGNIRKNRHSPYGSPCPDCGKRFARLKFREHMSSCHLNSALRAFVRMDDKSCSICGHYRAPTAARVARHVGLVHNMAIQLASPIQKAWLMEALGAKSMK